MPKKKKAVIGKKSVTGKQQLNSPKKKKMQGVNYNNNRKIYTP